MSTEKPANITISADDYGDAEEALARLSKAYLDRFGHYPPVHRMPSELAIASIEDAFKSGEPLDPEPFTGSGCNCA